MKKLHLTTLLATASLAFACNSFAGDYYVSAQAGASIAQGKLKSANISDDKTANKTLKSSAVYDLTFGRNISPELELAYTKHNFKAANTDIFGYSLSRKAHINSLSSFVNATYKLSSLNLPVVPYVTAGVGVASNKTSKINYVGKDGLGDNASYTAAAKRANNFAWQVGVGVLVPVQENLSINLSCKYRDLGKVSSVNNVTDNSDKEALRLVNNKALKGRLSSLSLLAGISYSF